MRAPEFWWRKPETVASLFAPLASLYGSVAASRMRRTGAHAKVPVICVGNPTLGGAGKTPTALTIASMLKEQGEKPFFLTRGYGGRIRGPVRVDIQNHSARDTGDEPLLLARAFPTIVSRDRVAGAVLAASSGASVVVMDDEFQNPSLHKDFSLLVVDGSRCLGNGLVFPAGPLRAPLEAQYERAQCIVVVGERAAGTFLPNHGLPMFAARLEPDASAAALKGKRVLAFAGIGNPEKFFASLREIGAELAETRPFADHHVYTASEARDLVDTAQARSLTLVTTEKDLARMSGNRALASLAAATTSLPVKLKFSNESAIEALLKRALETARVRISA